MGKLKEKLEHEIDHLESALKGLYRILPNENPNNDYQTPIYMTPRQKLTTSNTKLESSSMSSIPTTDMMRSMSGKRTKRELRLPSHIGTSPLLRLERATESSGMSTRWTTSGPSQSLWRRPRR